ncbi:MAG: hypothetical protein ACTSXU_10910 [Promethearchaeota archaeon]
MASADPIQLFISFFDFIAISIILIVSLLRLNKERKVTGKLNLLRFQINLVIFLLFIQLVFKLFSTLGYLPEVSSYSEFGYNTLLVGLQISIAFIVVFQVYNILYVKYAPLYFFIGLVFFNLTTGTNILYAYFIYIGGPLMVFGLISIGIMSKNNNPLGLGIYALLLFSNILRYFMPGDIALIYDFVTSIIGHLFGIIFAFGKFRIYKEHAKVDEREEALNVEVKEE